MAEVSLICFRSYPYTIAIPLREFNAAFVRLPTRQMPHLEKRTLPTDAAVIEGCWWGQEPVFHTWAFWRMLVASPFWGNSQNIFQKLWVCLIAVYNDFLTWPSCLNMLVLLLSWQKGKRGLAMWQTQVRRLNMAILILEIPLKEIPIGNCPCFCYIFESSQCYSCRFGWLVELWFPNCLWMAKLILDLENTLKKTNKISQCSDTFMSDEPWTPSLFFPALPFLFSWNVWDIRKK